MLKKMLLAVLAFIALTGSAMAAVDVNTADQAQLETLKGIGPAHAKAIVDERNAHGPFKDERDLANRVKGMGEKSVAKLQAEGLTVSGKGAATMDTKATATADAKAMDKGHKKSKKAKAKNESAANAPAAASAAGQKK